MTAVLTFKLMKKMVVAASIYAGAIAPPFVTFAFGERRIC